MFTWGGTRDRIFVNTTLGPKTNCSWPEPSTGRTSELIFPGKALAALTIVFWSAHKMALHKETNCLLIFPTQPVGPSGWKFCLPTCGPFFHVHMGRDQRQIFCQYNIGSQLKLFMACINPYTFYWYMDHFCSFYSFWDRAPNVSMSMKQGWRVSCLNFKISNFINFQFI